jgi:hypothetical protein
MAVLITNLPADKKAYFTVSVWDGTNTYTANAGDSGAILDNGTQGLSLPLTIYGITVTAPVPGTGTLSANKPAAVAGASVGVTATPAANYTIYPVNGTPTVTRAGDSGTETVSGSGPYTFTMPADNVTVSVVFKSSLKAITAFNITSPVTATGRVDEGAKTVTITVPGGTAVNSMTTAITLSPGATVNPAAGSGANFTTPTKTYTVSAENGSTQDYGVTVNRTVNALNLSSLVSAPVTGAAPNTTAINETQYTGSISWLKNDNSAHSGNFAGAAVYKAQVSLIAQSGYTFTGVAANSFTYTGATVSNAAGGGTTLTVTITFPATAAVVDEFNLSSLVTASVAGYTPDTTAINETQYTGTVAWQTASDSLPHSGAFAVGTVYKAVVSLSAKTGYTFTGVGTNAFTYTGATSVSNTANSGVVTITFPAAPAVVDQLELNNTLTLTSVVSVPSTGWTPNTPPMAPPSSQYNRNIVYRTLDDQNVLTVMPNTVYKAVVTLSANSGHTFYGLPVNNFIHTGAAAGGISAVNNGATIIVTIVFPATGPLASTGSAAADETTLRNVISGAADGAVLTIQGSFDVTTESINVLGKDITIKSPPGQTLTFNLKGGWKAFVIGEDSGADASLTLGTANPGDSGAIVFDGGAVWGGTADPTLGRGTTNSGASGREPFIRVSTSGTFTMYGGVTMQNNSANVNANVQAGAIQVDGTAVIHGGTIQNCYAPKTNDSAGAIYVRTGGASLTINGGTITGNQAGSGDTAGSILVNGPYTTNFEWIGGTISGNLPNDKNNGSINVKSGATVNLHGNTAY